MNTWIQFILAVLAIYRVAHMLSLEEGPFGVFERLRDWAGVYNYGDNGEPETRLGRMVRCPLCLGVHVSLLVTLLFIAWPTWLGNLALIWLGLAGAQAVLHRLIVPTTPSNS